MESTASDKPSSTGQSAIEGFPAKRAYIAFWADFYFCRIELGLAHDVDAQLRNKNGLTLDFLLFLIILKSSGCKTLQN